MNFDLRTYLKCYKGWFSQDICANVVNDLNKSNWKAHSFYNALTKESKTFDNDLSITWELPQWQEKINGEIWKVIEQYIVKDFNFSWHSGWAGYTGVRFNKYEVGTEMHEHCDHIQSMFDGERKGIPILSVVGCLNDDYEGGDFVMWENEIINLKAGDIMVFPSNFLYPHKVTPVTKGTRYSYVSWVW